MLTEIRANGLVIDHESLTFVEAQRIVGGTVEVVRLPDHRLMLVNEDGRIRILPINSLASDMCHHTIIVGTVIVGDGHSVNVLLGGKT